MKKHLGIRVDEDLLKKIKYRAIEEGVSVQELVCRQLQRYLENSCPQCQFDYIIQNNDKSTDIAN